PNATLPPGYCVELVGAILEHILRLRGKREGFSKGVEPGLVALICHARADVANLAVQVARCNALGNSLSRAPVLTGLLCASPNARQYPPLIVLDQRVNRSVRCGLQIWIAPNVEDITQCKLMCPHCAVREAAVLPRPLLQRRLDAARRPGRPVSR